MTIRTNSGTRTFEIFEAETKNQMFILILMMDQNANGIFKIKD